MLVSEDVVLPRRLWMELVQWRSGYQCEECGLNRNGLQEAGRSGHLHGHHIDHDDQNNRLDNGRCLCPSCHGLAHADTKGSKPCKAGCKCGRHKEAANRIQLGQLCKRGHDDWVTYVREGRVQNVCKTCRSEYLKRYYKENEAYRERQKTRSTERKRALRKGGD